MAVLLGGICGLYSEKKAKILHSNWKKTRRKTGAYSSKSISAYKKLVDYIKKNRNLSNAEANEYIYYNLGQ